MRQIWNDTDFTLSGQTRPVRITVDGKEIFRGVLNAYPNEEDVSMLINKVCEPFLEMDYPATSGVTKHGKAYRIFMVEDWSGNTLGSQDFIYDWSYEAWRPVMSDPVNGKLDPRMRLPYTMWNSAAGSIDIDIVDYGGGCGADNVCSSDYVCQADGVCYSDCGIDCPSDNTCSYECYADGFCPSDALIEDEVQILGEESSIYGGVLYIHFDKTKWAGNKIAATSSEYYDVTVESNVEVEGDLLDIVRLRTKNNSVPPVGTVSSVSLYNDGNYIGDVVCRVTAPEFGTGNTVPSSVSIYETVTVTPSIGLPNGGGNGRHMWLTDGVLNYMIALNTLISTGITSMAGQFTCFTEPSSNLVIQKNDKSNSLMFVSGRNPGTDISLRLESGYCAFLIWKYARTGLTDLYIEDTVDWFNSIPTKNAYLAGTVSQCEMAKWFRGQSGDSITVHCTDGTITWTVNEIIT